MAESQYKIEISINGQEVSLNSFVQSFYMHTLLGSLQALKDMPNDVQSLQIQIKKTE